LKSWNLSGPGPRSIARLPWYIAFLSNMRYYRPKRASAKEGIPHHAWEPLYL
jgi:hypothetical protein